MPRACPPPDLPLPDPAVFTVTVAGPERHDGEAGYTYVLPAPDQNTAVRPAMAYHAAAQELRLSDLPVRSRWDDGWRWPFDPATAPDVVHVPAQSFPGPPPWPPDTPGRAWHDLRGPVAQAETFALVAAEDERLETARAFGIPVADIDFGAASAPAVPAPVAVRQVAQIRARRALAPARDPAQGADISPFICPLPHINALATAIDTRNLAPGIDPGLTGQVLLDENYRAVNIGHGTDDEAPPYEHLHRDADAWRLLKACDCYHYQLSEHEGFQPSAAWQAVEALRQVLLAELGAEGSTDYLLRRQYLAADGWPLLDPPSAAVRRAQDLIGRYELFDGIERLHPADWVVHGADIIADRDHPTATYTHGPEPQVYTLDLGADFDTRPRRAQAALEWAADQVAKLHDWPAGLRRRAHAVIEEAVGDYPAAATMAAPLLDDTVDPAAVRLARHAAGLLTAEQDAQGRTDYEAWLTEHTGYAAACRQAATSQGLDPISRALHEAGIEHDVDQTGGFCMVVHVPTPHGFHIGITASEDEHAQAGRHWLVVRRSNTDLDDEGEVTGYAVPTPDVIALLAGYLAPPAKAAAVTAVQAVNTATDWLREELDVCEGEVDDLLNLIVNATGYAAEHPDDGSLAAAIEANYDGSGACTAGCEDPDQCDDPEHHDVVAEVLSWLDALR